MAQNRIDILQENSMLHRSQSDFGRIEKRRGYEAKNSLLRELNYYDVDKCLWVGISFAELLLK